MISRLVPVVVLWAVVIGRWPMLRRPGPSRVLWVTFLLSGSACVLRLPPVYEWVGRVSGSLVLAPVLKLGLVVAACAGLMVLISILPGGRPRAARDCGIAAVAILILSVPVLLSPPVRVAPVVAASGDFYNSTWRSLVHWVPYIAYVGWAMASGVMLAGRNARLAPYRRLATGLRLVAIGCGFGVIHAVLKLATLVAWHTDPSEAGTWMSISGGPGSVGLALGVTLIAVGSAWEGLAEAVGRWRQVVWGRWALWRLEVLWGDLVQLYPQVRLHEDGDSTGRVRYRLVRRVVEIQDGILHVGRRLDPTILDRMQAAVAKNGVVGEAASAGVVALAIKWAAGHAGEAGGGYVELPHAEGVDIWSEVRWLLMVVKAYKKLGTTAASTAELVSAK